jgi:acyl carrier protein
VHASEIAEREFDHVAEDTTIADLGMDSLSTLELVGELERELDNRIASEELVDVETIRQLLDLVARKLVASA